MWKRNSRPQQASGLSTEEVDQRLRAFVAGRQLLVGAEELTPETCLFSTGLLDSLSFAELVFFVERDLHVPLGDRANATMSSMDRFGDAVRLIVGASRGPT